MKRQLTHMEEVESELATSKQHVTELTASLEKTQQEAASAQDQLTEQLSEEKEKLAESQTETAAVTKKLQTVEAELQEVQSQLSKAQAEEASLRKLMDQTKQTLQGDATKAQNQLDEQMKLICFIT